MMVSTRQIIFTQQKSGIDAYENLKFVFEVIYYCTVLVRVHTCMYLVMNHLNPHEAYPLSKC